MSFISILVTRLGGVLDRLRSPADSPEDRHSAKIGIEVSRLWRRVGLLNRAIYFAIGSGVVAVVLIIVSFAAALLSMTHVWAAAVLFIISLVLLCGSLVVFGMEVKISLGDYNQQ